MSNELERERNQGLRVGYLVQCVEENNATGKEGILVAIRRPASPQRFTYFVDWQDGGSPEAFTRKQIALTKFLNYPHYKDAALTAPKWMPGAGHVWVTLKTRGTDDYASCLYCMRVRQYLAEKNTGNCSGQVKFGFR